MKRNSKLQQIAGAKIIPRGKHNISERQINKNAKKVVRHLNKSGFDAHIVGGGVRDLLLGKHPKDFDVVTNALPNEIKKIFHNCHLIGRRFRLAHIYFGKEIIEVATFRAGHFGAQPHEASTREGMVTRDNVYGTIEEDAKRRDFTVNALYYSTKNHTLLNFFHGFEDLCHKKLDAIGDPETRYREDPVRMLRAARIAGKSDFTITDSTKEPILKLSHLLKKIPKARLFDETIKLFQTGASQKIYPLLQELGLLEQLFPLTAQASKKEPSLVDPFINHFLYNTDKRIQQKKSVAPAFLFAALLWHPLLFLYQELSKKIASSNFAFETAIKQILQEQRQFLSIPRYVSYFIRDIWHLQHRLEQRRARFVEILFSHPRFRAAYDFLLLRAEEEKDLTETTDWWAEFQSAKKRKQDRMIKELRTLLKS